VSLTATPGNNQATLAWTAVAGATSYNVYEGTVSGGESTTPIATGITSATYTVTGLNNGTSYFFEVAAVNSSGTSVCRAKPVRRLPLRKEFPSPRS